MRIIGLDVGTKRIGVARADSSVRIAIPMGFIEVNGNEWQEIARIARIQGTNFFVVGLPRSNEGKETAQSLYVRNFVKKLTEIIPDAKIRLQDESLTSVLAEDRLKKQKGNFKKGDVDAEAATIILQDFLETLQSQAGIAEKATQKIANSAPGVKKNSTGSVLESANNIARKEADKVKFKTKKAKHRLKSTVKWVLLFCVLLGLAVGGFFGIKWYRAEQRAAEYARLEAEMVPETFTFTILPGENLFDIKEKFLLAGYSNAEIDAAFAAEYDFGFLKERPDGASLEGYLFGETHEFYKSSTVQEVIETFLAGMEKVIQENELKQKYALQGLSLFEGVTLASVIQKEVVPSDQAEVARVFLNRLEVGMTLGSDATVSYAVELEDPDRQIYTDNQSALQIDSCYNTRNHGGLPCGPISNPGLSALLAVAEPADNSYLYFLTGDDGMVYYSHTDSEHRQNIVNYCQELCNVSL